MLANRIPPAPEADTLSSQAGPGEAAPNHILRPGRNVWRMEKADRAAVLIDAAARYKKLVH